MGRIRKVGLVVKRDRPRAVRLARRMLALLRAQKVGVLVDVEAGLDDEPTATKDQLARETDLIVVLGGDGTLLGVARKASARVPILGINLGQLGFLTAVTEREGLPMLRRVLAGDYEVESRMTVSAALRRNGRVVSRFRALNDVVVSSGVLARMITCAVCVDDKPLTTYRADGLIVATPTGSTAYSLSVGGAIVDPTLQVLLLSPISPHTLSNRPLVLRPDGVIRITLAGRRQHVVLTVDGQEVVTLSPNDEVVVRRSPTRVSLVRPPHRTHYDVLRSKLGWGGERGGAHVAHAARL